MGVPPPPPPGTGAHPTELLLGFTHVTNSLATVTIRHLGAPQGQTNRIERGLYVGK